MARRRHSAGAREFKAGDDSTNARKRFYRKSQRYLDKADESSGATSDKYRQLARQAFDDALNTYEPSNKQKYSKPIRELAEIFGYDLEGHREKRVENQEFYKKVQERALTRSSEALESATEDPDERRQAEARALLNNDAIGSRILGGLVDIWKKDAAIYDDEGNYLGIDEKAILPSLYNYFKVDNLADLIDKIEEIVGEDLYKDPSNDSMYDAVKLVIQTHVIENESIE